MCLCMRMTQILTLYSAIYYLYEPCFGVFNCCWKASFVPFWGEFVRDMNCERRALLSTINGWSYSVDFLYRCALSHPPPPPPPIIIISHHQHFNFIPQYERITITTTAVATTIYSIRKHSIITISVSLVETCIWALCILLYLYDADG